MITFPELIKWGRLGNQLFEMAATVALALDHGDDYGFNRSWNGIRWPYSGRFPIDDGCFLDQLADGPDYWEPTVHYRPIPYQPNVRLHGYFFSERYFKHHEERVRSLLTPVGVSGERLEGVASVHIRRGDYVLLPDQHPTMPIDYYLRAAEYLRSVRNTQRFIVVSDDLEWCRRHLPQPLFEFADASDDLTHLKLMIACEHNIVANSTFSWWGAWLNPNPDKMVVAPSKWFGKAYDHDIRDLWPPEWITLKVDLPGVTCCKGERVTPGTPRFDGLSGKWDGSECGA